MRLLAGPALLGAALIIGAAAATQSSKRGLVYVRTANNAQDDSNWDRDGSGLTWYYNYQSDVSPAYSSIPQSQLEFVPMMWGYPQSNEPINAFYRNVTALIASGRRITHAMAFNEPDGRWEWGGSQLEAGAAARYWIENFEPLRAAGVKVGLPVPMYGDVNGWLAPFLGNCSLLLTQDNGGGKTRNCSFDFVPVHVYGQVEDLAGRVATFALAFPGKPIWVTEWALNDRPLSETQSMYNRSIDFLDNNKTVERYSYFGSFRSQVSNVGPNAAMLDANGQLTDIGSWYLGGGATGHIPTKSSANGLSSSDMRHLLVLGLAWTLISLGGL